VVPESVWTLDLCLEAARISGWILYNMPEELRTEAVCKTSVCTDGMALQFVPERLKTLELCLLAAETIGRRVLEYAPQHLQDSLTAELNKRDYSHLLPWYAGSRASRQSRLSPLPGES
ncbi:MAG: DUF4116 domain-containing protein, partial [Desulfovibrio sp.]|nr:DUF4116 domain-containing protein [Desulfovibrio sp.]